jgi:hypothetical protein
VNPGQALAPASEGELLTLEDRTVRPVGLLAAAALLLTLGGCGCGCRPDRKGAATDPATPLPVEVEVVSIPLRGDLTDPQAEISGLAWFGDFLVLLPQYPNRFAHARPGSHGTLFAIAEDEILAVLDGRSTEPILPRPVALIAPGLAESVDGYNGLEAICFLDDRVFITIESRSEDGMQGYLLGGVVSPGLETVELEVDRMVPIPVQVDIGNMAEESLLLADGRVVTIHEANGVNVNPEPVAHLFDPDLGHAGSVSMPNVEYRVTDATALDDRNRFWVINYFYPPELAKLKPAHDLWSEQFGKGASHSECPTVERLLEFRYTDEGVRRTRTPPLQLRLLGTEICRNWEGLVRLQDRGFLLATDKYPETLLGFAPFR